jgi:hypothetical protein
MFSLVNGLSIHATTNLSTHKSSFSRMTHNITVINNITINNIHKLCRTCRLRVQPSEFGNTFLKSSQYRPSSFNLFFYFTFMILKIFRRPHQWPPLVTETTSSDTQVSFNYPSIPVIIFIYR